MCQNDMEAGWKLKEPVSRRLVCLLDMYVDVLKDFILLHRRRQGLLGGMLAKMGNCTHGGTHIRTSIPCRNDKALVSF